jgi:hypothetical protein
LTRPERLALVSRKNVARVAIAVIVLAYLLLGCMSSC